MQSQRLGPYASSRVGDRRVNAPHSRNLAAAVPRVGIEELIEVGETKGRQLLFIPIPCRSQGFEIARDLCPRLRVQIAAPGRPQNTIHNFGHSTPALQWLHCSISRRFRQIPRARLASAKKIKAPRERRSRPFASGRPRPSGARPATPTEIAIGPARRIVRSESGAKRRTGDLISGSAAFRQCGCRARLGRGLARRGLAGISALGATAACLVSGRAASSAGAVSGAGLASFSSDLLESGTVGALLTSMAAGALLTSVVAEALTASPVVSALPGSLAVRTLLVSAVAGALAVSTASGALLASAAAGFSAAAVAARSAALCRSMKSLQLIGKTISPETVRPIGVQPPGGGPSSADRGWGSDVCATPAPLIPNITGSVAAEMRRTAHKCLIANNSTNENESLYRLR